jgi:LAS superfamily LD-carboxypeptidase LdcB
MPTNRSIPFTVLLAISLFVFIGLALGVLGLRSPAAATAADADPESVTEVAGETEPEGEAEAEPEAEPDPEPVTNPTPRFDESTMGPGTSVKARKLRGEYSGTLVPINRTSACPNVSRAFFRMRAAAARSGVPLYVRSGFRTKKHQGRLFRELGPVYAARPGKSLHHAASELDIVMRPGGGDNIHVWLTRNAGRFGFIQRYSWEPWHWGYVKGC